MYYKEALDWGCSVIYMYIKEKIAAVVLAGGQGKRMNSRIPKQFLLLEGRPIIYYALKAFQNSCVDEIVLVTSSEDIEYCRKEIVEAYGFDKVTHITAGGAERYNSVYNGLLCVRDSRYVLIHDGARPFITEKMINDNIEQVKISSACITGVPSKDTVKISDEQGFVAKTPERSKVWIVQTPQTFDTALIIEAYEKMFEHNDGAVTDDAMVVEKYCSIPVKFVMGAYTNIKITTPEDMRLAQVLVGHSE